MKSSKYLSPKEAATLLGISTHLLQKWRSLGVGIPYIKLGQSRSSVVRYKKSDLLKYLDKNTIQTL
ncbi:helix-turn-helix domain-containing protein [Sulfurovum sp. NBC37-1]|uniref:helix-turn-helix domain-containing protein n=1 Tax=Sulfurovum sp. (strain NBC37-1) TaxID=387093 RepID=UPI0005A2A1E9|nr:helix-turn-helix domain-containing protein [Sulfurovum sp. NBC37-1]